MDVKSFEDLIVWQKAHQLTLEIYKVTKEFPKAEKFGLISQIRRSTASIFANIAEGQTKSRKDFLRFLDIARGSLEETKYHLILSRDLTYCTEEQFKMLYELSDEIGKMIYGLSQQLRRLTHNKLTTDTDH